MYTGNPDFPGDESRNAGWKGLLPYIAKRLIREHKAHESAFIFMESVMLPVS